MSLKNASLDKGLIDSIKVIDSLNNIEDIGKSLRGKKTDEIADILGRSKKNFNIDELSDIANIAGVTDDLGDLANMVDEVSDSQKGVNGLATSFKNLGKMIKTAIFNPYTAMIAVLVGAKFAIDAYYEKFEKLVTAAEDSQSTYASTVSEIKTLDSEIETTSAKIAELENQGTLSITDEAELDRLRIQNLELERQRDLKQQLADEQSKTATKDAMEALTLQRTVDLTQQKAVPHGASRHDYINPTVQYVNTDIVTAAKNEVAALTELRDKRKELLTDDISDDSQVQEFEELDEKISQFETEINTHLTSLVSLRDNFIDQSTGLVKENLTVDELDMFNSLSAILDDYNNIDLTPAERELNKIKQFFDGSFGKNQIKDYLLEATENGMSAAVAIERLGVDLESAGLDAQALNEYFRGMRNSAENAKDSVQDYAATISDIETAKASEDQDKNWSTISESYKEAKELLKEGKTGTDNFQMMASFLNPEKVKDLAEEGGKYTADAYQKAFEEIQKTANRWFGEDETKSMEHFVNDFKKKGLFDVETDDMGLWDITTNFKTTAEAAEEFGISIEAVETMLDALGAYGYEFEGITFSADALSEYQSYLEGIQTIYDEIDNSELKDRLGEIIDQAKLDDFENNIESLSPEIVAKIEFEYNLAQIDQEIQRLKAQLSGAGYNDSGSNAEIIAANESRTQKWREENSKAAKDTGYAGTDETIAKLERSMVGKSDEVIESTQRKIMALQDLRTAYENTFDDSNGTISWEEFINSSEANTVFSNLAEEFGVAKDDLEQIAAEGVKVDVDGDVTSFYNKLTGILSNDGKTIVMHIEATTDQIQAQIDQLQEGQRVLFTAEINGEPVGISAYKDIDGTIKYVAEDDGVAYFLEKNINPDGTITYTPNTDAVDAYDYDQDGVVEYIGKFPDKAPTLYGAAKYKASLTGKIPKLTGSELYDGVATGTMLSPAHKDGTAYNVLNTLPAFADGNVALDKNQRALVNEECINGHSESIVRDGVWRLIPGGAHLENLKKGDIIFSAQQTEDLLRHGKTPGHARAYAQGTVLAPAYGLPGGKKNNKSNKSNKNNKTTPPKTIVDTTEKTTKQLEKAFKEFEKLFDWVEVRLDRLGRNSQNAEDAIERATDLADTLSKTNTAISKVNKERDAAARGADEYLVQAKKVAKQTGLSEAIQKKIHNGSIRISDYREETQKKIQEYQNW